MIHLYVILYAIGGVIAGLIWQKYGRIDPNTDAQVYEGMPSIIFGLVWPAMLVMLLMMLVLEFVAYAVSLFFRRKS